MRDFERAVKDKNIISVVACAPSSRVALGEMFGLPFGTNVEKQMISALKAIGFDYVFDLNFGADLTITEEAEEFVRRYKSGQNLPHLTSCCPAWVRFVENRYPSLVKNLSTTKSPQQIFGACMKTYFAEKMNIPLNRLFVATVMPCIAKKAEKDRPGIDASGEKDVDEVITVKELGDYLLEKRIDLKELSPSEFDRPLGMASGAGVIFGTTGGVMESALRSISSSVGAMGKTEYYLMRGMRGVKEAEVKVGDKTLRLAVASGLVSAKALLDKVVSGEKRYDFIEVMACPGGCVNGTGQPSIKEDSMRKKAIRKRAKGLYLTDMKAKVRVSNQNSSIMTLYKNYFGEPCSKRAKKILHVKYVEEKK